MTDHNSISELFVVERGLRDLVGIIPDTERGELMNSIRVTRESQKSVQGQVMALMGLLRSAAPQHTVDHRPRFITPADILSRTERCAHAAVHSQSIDPTDARQLFVAAKGAEPAWNKLLAQQPPKHFSDLEYCQSLAGAFSETDSLFRGEPLPFDQDILMRKAMTTGDVSADVLSNAGEILGQEFADHFAVMTANDFSPHRVSAMHSMPSYREYGLRPFVSCFGSNAGGLVAQYAAHDVDLGHSVARVFREGYHSHRVSLKFPYAHLDETLTDTLCCLPDSELSAYIASFDPLDDDNTDRSTERFNAESTRDLIGFYAELGIPSLPRRLWCTYSEDSVARLKAGILNKNKVCDEFGIPAINRMRLFRSMQGVNEMAALMRNFMNAGLSPQYSAPYIDFTLNEREIRMNQDLIYGLVSMERRMESRHVKNPGKTDNAIYEIIADATVDRLASLDFLEVHGLTYEALTPLQRRHITPEKLAHRLKRYHEGEVDARVIRRSYLANKTAGTIDQRIQSLVDERENKERDNVELTHLLVERGLTLPEYFINNPRNFTPTRILAKIRYIESCGVPFTGEGQWSWVNLGPDNLNRKIGKEFLRVNNEAHWKQLAYAYELNEIPHTLQTKPAWSAWKYLYMAKQAGLAVGEFSLGTTHVKPLHGEWREHICRMILRKGEKGGRLNDLNKLYLRKHDLAKEIERFIHWKDAGVLLDQLGVEECNTIARVLMSGNGAALEEVLGLLEDDFHLREEAIKRLINSGMPLPDIEYCIECFSADELQEKVALFDDHHMRIDSELFIRDISDIESALTNSVHAS